MRPRAHAKLLADRAVGEERHAERVDPVTVHESGTGWRPVRT
jgi:hypothetical protein